MIDAKLLATVLTSVIAWVVVKVGLDVDDATVASLASIGAGAIAGYLKSNDGTILRTEHEDGNAVIPEEKPKRKPTKKAK